MPSSRPLLAPASPSLTWSTDVDLDKRNESLTELRQRNRQLSTMLLMMASCVLLLCVKLVFQSEIVATLIPGMPSGVTIEKSQWDKKAQQATLQAVTNAIVAINPANSEYQKQLIQVFLAPEAYTKVSLQIDDRVNKLKDARELGSYYFVWRGYDYDPVLDKHFEIGEFHTVNAAKDTYDMYVFEYRTHVENYRFVIDTVDTYPGEQPHDSAWLKAHRKPQ